MKRKLISFDWALKKLLRSKADFVIVEGFLSELLNEDIKILEVLESESNKERFDDKYNRVDVKVKNEKKEIILIEIQYGRELDYFQRILYGTSKVIVEHIKESDSYSKVVKVISISIIYFDFAMGKDYIYKGKTEFRGIHNNELLDLSIKQQELFKVKEINKIYPEYYLLKVNNFDDIAKTRFDEWIYFLKNEEIEDGFKAKGLKEAKEKLDYMKMKEKDKKEYDSFKESLHMIASSWESSYEVGKLDGIKDGIKKGEKKKSIEIAKNLLDILDDETISKKTGLKVEEIKKLRKS
jgi:predicted transposase/invertase (TIGR01784 family)